MSFRDFITNRLYRRWLSRELDRREENRPPVNPSRQYIEKLVEQLLDEQTAWDAREELSKIKAAAVPALTAALQDPRYHLAEWPTYSHAPIPLEAVLELLVPHAPEHVLAAAASLANSPSAKVRKIVALQVAATGRIDAIPLMASLLKDADGYVRAYVKIGVDRALEAERVDAAYRQAAYDLLLDQCDQQWSMTINDAAWGVVALDPARAAVDFSSERWLSPINPNLYDLMRACTSAGIRLPEQLVRAALDYSLPLAVGERCYPHQYVAAAALEALTLATGAAARPLVKPALTHEQEQIREAAANCILRLAGLSDPVSFVLDRVRTDGYDALSAAQRVVYLAFLFDAEVCNGGIMQFFGNSSGDQAADTLEALRTLNHPVAERALAEAMRLVGPLAREPDRDMRLAAFEGRFDELQAAFGPLESEYYKVKGLRERWLLYAADHPDQFRA